MATVRVRSTGQTLTESDAIGAALAPHGIVYEQWDISKLEAAPRQPGVSAEDHVLTTFADEIDALSRSRGYQSADVIALKPDTPGLDDLLAKFDREHTHSEDEVRFVVSGRGVFVVRGVDGELYDVEVHAGDLLAVPEGTPHWFTLCDDRHIQCIRLFTSRDGWVAHYVEASPGA